MFEADFKTSIALLGVNVASREVSEGCEGNTAQYVSLELGAIIDLKKKINKKITEMTARKKKEKQKEKNNYCTAQHQHIRTFNYYFNNYYNRF